MIVDSLKYVREIALGGTAVGTGINAHADFADVVAQKSMKKQMVNSFQRKTNSMH